MSETVNYKQLHVSADICTSLNDVTNKNMEEDKKK